LAWCFQQAKNLPLIHKVSKALPDIKFRIAEMPSKSMDEETEAAVEALKQLKNIAYAGYVKRSSVL
jgi:hypothetical protein